jgi:hypothetical protein
MLPPDPAAVRAWIGVPATVLTDEQLDDVMSAERSAQSRLCNVGADDVDEPDLSQALLRRIGRAVAARNLPTGLVPGSEFGLARLPLVDAEIERYESTYRIPVLG